MNWEYKVEPAGWSPPDEKVIWLNQLGEEGWELVAGMDGKLYFKRFISI